MHWQLCFYEAVFWVKFLAETDFPTQVSWNEYWNGQELKGVLLAGNCQDKPKRRVPPPKEGSQCVICFLGPPTILRQVTCSLCLASFYLCTQVFGSNLWFLLPIHPSAQQLSAASEAFRTMERANQLAETSLKEAMAELSKKLGLFERVRHVCQSVEIPLPGVVVVGEQSAGKSSLLENISGIQFPRAQNTCTRMPCVLTLLTDPTVQESFAEVSMDSSFAFVPWIKLRLVCVFFAGRSLKRFRIHSQMVAGEILTN